MNPHTASMRACAIWGAARPDFRAPSFLMVMWNTARRFLRGPLRASPPNPERDALLREACVAIQGGRADDALDLLAPRAGTFTNDPGYLNLLGAVCEVREQWRLAQRCYGAAISIAPGFEPAQRNMRRLYELYTFGRTRESLALGDAALRRDDMMPTCPSHSAW